MEKDARRHLYLIGFSFSGKSTAGRRAAQELGMDFVDTDDLVEAQASKSVADIFAQDGEERFRLLESQILQRVAGGRPSVVATGGGIVLRGKNRELLRRTGVVISLQTRPETIHRRALASAARHGNATARPLLAGDDPLARIEALLDHRLPFYAIADWTAQTDYLDPPDLANEIVRGWRQVQSSPIEAPSYVDRLNPNGRELDAPYCADAGAAATVDTGAARYGVFVEAGLLESLGIKLKNLGLKGRVFIVGDDTVIGLYGNAAENSLRDAGYETETVGFPPGEQHKTLRTVETVYDRLLEKRVERRDTIVALGGGVSGDLAGYVAATILRGVNLVHLPTSLLAMADASIGGKTGVDHPAAKNMIGAFYHPKAVYCDVALLASLPERHYIAGWAEIIKHGMILDAELFARLEASVDAILARDAQTLAELIGWSARIKAGIVSEDERESGRRTLLNYGHTIGHALESTQDYGGLLHGEAIAIGMHVAGRLSVATGRLSQMELKRQSALLEAIGLRITLPEVSRGELAAAVSLDKKVDGGAVRWVLLDKIGRGVIDGSVDARQVEAALAAST